VESEAVPTPVGEGESCDEDAFAAAVGPIASAAPTLSAVIDVRDLDWTAIRAAFDKSRDTAGIRTIVERAEALLSRKGGPGLLFDADREDENDRVIRVRELPADGTLWIIGDLHGDLLALEAALHLIYRESDDGGPPRIVFLGDFFDDGGYGLEVLLRVFKLLVESPASVCVVIGNHEEALGHGSTGFTSTVSPADFVDFLNAHLADEWIRRSGQLAMRLAAVAPRALILPDGLLITHGGFPLVDLHEELRETRAWNDPRCLSDFTWTRAHPRARKKMPNRNTRGSSFGYEDFAAFCALSAELGHPVTHMVRGHDHVDERFEIPQAYAANPVLTTVALSRQLPRELIGPYERVPTVARWVSGALPEVYRLHVPADLVQELYPQAVVDDALGDKAPSTRATT
jgi:hypothetical protein